MTVLQRYRAFLIDRFNAEARLVHYMPVVFCWLWIELNPRVWPVWHPIVWITFLAFPVGILWDFFGGLPRESSSLATWAAGLVRFYAFLAWQNVASVVILFLWTSLQSAIFL